MFKKPLAHQSNATPLRSSARRQLLQSIYEQYPDIKLGLRDAEETEGEGLTEKELSKLILPEGVKVSSIDTSGGVEGTLHSADGNPLWMSFGRNSKELIPTLSLLAEPLPSPPLPILKLHHPVPPPLFTGAPLFLPAVRNLHEPWRLPDVAEGGLVAFVSSPTGDNMVEYVGVGRVVARGGVRDAVERLTRHRREGREMDEGKFCDVLCIVGDHLWEMGTKPPLRPFALPLPIRPLQPSPARTAQPAGPASSASIIGNDNSAPSGSATPDEAMQNLAISEAETTVPSETNALSASEISALLNLGLYQSLTSLGPSSFPMPASQLYSVHVLPNRPSYIPLNQRENVVIAKSEWKKLAKWMKELSKDGILKTKEVKGEVVVTGFDPSHPILDSHAPFTTIAEDEAKAAKKAAREAPAEATSNGLPGMNKGKGKEIVIEELWKPSRSSVAFWEACGVDKSQFHPPPLLKSAAEAYFVKHNLVDLQDRRMIALDEELGRAVGVKHPTPGQSMTREEILRKLRAGVSWSTSVGGVIKKGTLEPIMLSVKTRNNRRTVTSIINLESFGIDLEDLAEELKKACAGSASIQPLQGASPKLGLQEILVQGSQVKIVTEALLARGVPRKWVKEGEGDKKRK